MIIRSKGSFPGVVVGLDPDAVTLIAAMTTTPDAARQQVISDHIVALKAAGIWSQLDIYYIMAAHHEQASRLNWKSPGDFTLTANGGITFTVDRGWQGNGSTGYLDTGWIPATHGVNYTLNDASFGVYSRTDTQGPYTDMSANSSILSRLSNVSLWNNTGQFHTRVNQASAGNVVVGSSSSLGFYVARRTASAAQQNLRNGSVTGSNTTSSTAATEREFFIGARNDNGAAVEFSPRQYTAAFTGAAMSEAQHAALYAAQQTGILAAVGAAV
jgi:hypothetical protein